MRLRFAVLATVLGSLTAGCQTAVPRAQEEPGQAKALEAQLLEGLSALPRHCPRPVLRGTARPGSGEAAALRAREAMAAPACSAVFERQDQPALDALAPCLPAVDALREAVSHEDLCSPWRAGIRANAAFLPLVRLGRLVSAKARALLDARQNPQAATLLLDAVRFSQDLARGGPSIVTAAIGHSIYNAVKPQLGQLLAQQHETPGLASQLAAELIALQGTEPDMHLLLRGEVLYSQLHGILSPLKGPDWVPPGGFESHGPPSPLSQEGPTFTSSVEGDMVLAWVAFDRFAKRLIGACPAGSTLDRCLSGLQLLHQPAPKHGFLDRLATTARVLLATDPAQAAREEALGILESIPALDYGRYVDGFVQRRVYLAQLLTRIHSTPNSPRSSAIMEAGPLGPGPER